MRDVRTLLMALATALVLLAGAPASGELPDRQTRSTSDTFFWANAWAAHHTARRGVTSGPQRMRRMVRLIHRTRVGVGVLAEIEHSQITSFRRAAASYDLVVGGRGTTDGVFWDARGYDLVDAYRFAGFGYRGQRYRVPVAVLGDRRTGRLLAVMAVHNPRDRWRSRALTRELEEVRRLRAAYARVEVFVAGDFNSGASVVCRARRIGLASAGNRRCGDRAPIDQMLADEAVRVSGYRRMSGRAVDRITDHPAVYRARFAFDPTTP